MRIVATTSLPAVDRLNDHRCNAACSCQFLATTGSHGSYGNSRYEDEGQVCIGVTQDDDRIQQEFLIFITSIVLIVIEVGHIIVGKEFLFNKLDSTSKQAGAKLDQAQVKLEIMVKPESIV